MVQITAKYITLEEFLKLPETEPTSEYIDGQIIQKPIPQGKHSCIQTELSAVINAILRSCQIGRAFTELRCTFAGRSIIQDISVFAWDRIPRDNNGQVSNVFQTSPDWSIEILSPDQNQTKATKNILHCLRDKTQMGWLIDPDEQTVFVYIRNQQPLFFDESEALLPVPEFASDLRLTVGELFEWLLG